ncbi:hypothetical protein EHF33_12165 [Deinococcus psychrotolerans]|uniref:Uncharacterized protein n=1 Tax=Deinococcus psychrotolerans TaxID=2489213 RepID=A0A3G8YGU1_9DEIO|nr:hypothetical protein EHF33_12165 [Deinococcus psychrotolerans]
MNKNIGLRELSDEQMAEVEGGTFGLGFFFSWLNPRPTHCAPKPPTCTPQPPVCPPQPPVCPPPPVCTPRPPCGGVIN